MRVPFLDMPALVLVLVLVLMGSYYRCCFAFDRWKRAGSAGAKSSLT
jgi:hypothetical protein